MKIKKQNLFKLKKKQPLKFIHVTPHNKNNSLYKIKKSLQTIYHFCILKKRILFVGVPIKTLKFYRTVLKDSAHFVIPENTWVKGLITNSSSCFYSLLKKKKITDHIKLLLDLKKKYSLVVLFNNSAALKESISKNIPTITFNSNFKNIYSSINSHINNCEYNEKVLTDYIHSMILVILQRLPNKDSNPGIIKRKKKFRFRFDFFKKTGYKFPVKQQGLKKNSKKKSHHLSVKQQFKKIHGKKKATNSFLKKTSK